ncbi:hypothetical protein SLEP1_g50460 [Rubroshorea leprosula]|uniref:Uncharacterized protein n=1 Tax=Rubroshorea leprosula TaxID=152421 RepID=A0AAV5M0Z7_9ROSI|nr:hypothetical protein SLEP1_g50460 [Rubroshorea leprosula]
MFCAFHEIEHAYLKVIVNCPDDLKVIVNCDFPVNFYLFCLRYDHVIRVPASGRFINASTCRHVSERAGDVYFVPVLYPFFVIAHVGML